jgi:hypothetical protein
MGVVMNARDVEALKALPPAESCRRIEFEKIQVVSGFITDTYFLIVSGTKPWVTMNVQLVPLIYIDKPEYWGIEVIGCQSGIGLPQTAPYSVALDITHFRGKKGIEVMGATRNEKRDVP